MKEAVVKWYDKVIQWSFVLLLFLPPLLVSPWNYYWYILPKITAIRLGTVLVLCLWLLKALREGRITIRHQPVDIPIAVFLMLATVSTLKSNFFVVSLYGKPNWYDGLLTTASYILLYYLVLNLFKIEYLSKAIIALILSATIIATYAIFQHFGFDVLMYGGIYWEKMRSWSTVGSPTSLGGYLAMVLPLITAEMLFGTFRKWARPALGIVLAIGSTVLLLTLTRAAWLAFGLSLILMVFLSWRDMGKNLRTLLLTGCVLAISGAGAYLIGILQGSYSLSARALSIFAAGMQGGRLTLWRNVLPITTWRPFFGSGPGTFYTISSLGGEGGTHNLILNIAVTLGLLGVFAYLAVLSSFFARGIGVIHKLEDGSLKGRGLGLIAGVFAYVIHQQFGPSSVTTDFFFWFFLGLSASVAAGMPNAPCWNLELAFGKGLFVKSLSYVFVLSLLAGTVFFSLRPVMADVRFARAQTLESRHRLDEAIEGYEQAIKLNSNDEFYLERLGRAYLIKAGLTNQQSYLDASIQSSNSALDINPNSVTAHLNLGYIFARQNQYDRAIYEFDKVASFDPGVVDAYRLMGRAYMKKGVLEKAKEAYQKALSLEPDNAEAKEALRRLGSTGGEKPQNAEKPNSGK